MNLDTCISVLLVEDNPDHVELFRSLVCSLQLPQCELHTCGSLSESVEIAGTHSFDLIFLDLGLPDAQGLETRRGFIAQVHRSPVIVLTAEDDFELGLESIKEGALDYLVKGQVPKSLFERVVRYALERFNLLTSLENEYQQTKNALAEKEVLLKEIHHRVKNNLQVISSLLKLQAGYCDIPEVKEILQQSEGRVRSMALVHEKLYQSDTFAFIDFATYLKELLRDFQQINSGNPEVEVVSNLQPINLGIDQAIPCGLLVNELITNAYKHAFRDQESRQIALELSEHGKEVVLKVRDNGVGIPPTIDFEKSPGLGLELVRTISLQLGGTLSLRRESGTEVVLCFEKRLLNN
ncbi:MAG: response regulator [Bdellovibrionales bacterium]|nr:response regulator [Bdellovibrionales bacterium]